MNTFLDFMVLLAWAFGYTIVLYGIVELIKFLWWRKKNKV